MLTTIVIVLYTISTLLRTVSTIGFLIGMYNQFVKKNIIKSNHILAYSFFLRACSYSLDGDNLVMILSLLLAIMCFRDYINGREAY